VLLKQSYRNLAHGQGTFIKKNALRQFDLKAFPKLTFGNPAIVALWL
jgi:hypothetical protein